MVRPKKCRYILRRPRVMFYKPRGVPMRSLGCVEITADELESLRLADLEGLSHEDAGKLMNVSRATFGRIVASARRKVAEGLINMKAISVDIGRYREAEPLVECGWCGTRVYAPPDEPRPEECPSCGTETKDDSSPSQHGEATTKDNKEEKP